MINIFPANYASNRDWPLFWTHIFTALQNAADNAKAYHVKLHFLPRKIVGLTDHWSTVFYRLKHYFINVISRSINQSVHLFVRNCSVDGTPRNNKPPLTNANRNKKKTKRKRQHSNTSNDIEVNNLLRGKHSDATLFIKL